MTNRSPDQDMSLSTTRLAEVKTKIGEAEQSADRPVGNVELIAISKRFEPVAIRPLLLAGHRVFGENKVQEAQAKWPALKSEFPDIKLHLVGSLQSNKSEDAVALFDVIHSLDRSKLVKTLAAAIKKTGRSPAFFVQVNTGAEAQKAGVLVAGLPALLEEARAAGLTIQGLMCLPPADEEPALHFALLAKLAKENGLDQLSMGMSGDFETAIRLGATHVRVGTALFGPRPPQSQ